MGDFPRGGIIARAARTIRAVAALKIPLHAANAGFFIVLSVFPALLLMLSLLRYTHLEVGDLLELLSSILPEALWDTAEELIISTYQNASASVVGVSAVTALWSASRGIHGLLGGLNAVYGVTESRGYFYARAISLLYTFAFLIVMLLTLGLHVFGSSLIGLLTMIDNPVLIFLVDIIDLRFFLLLFLGWNTGISSIDQISKTVQFGYVSYCIPATVAAPVFCSQAKLHIVIRGNLFRCHRNSIVPMNRRISMFGYSQRHHSQYQTQAEYQTEYFAGNLKLRFHVIPPIFLYVTFSSRYVSIASIVCLAMVSKLNPETNSTASCIFSSGTS